MGQTPSKAGPESKPTGDAPPGGAVTEPVFLSGDVHLAEGCEGSSPHVNVAQPPSQPPAAAAAPPPQPPSQQPTPAPTPQPREGKIEAIADYKIMRTLGQGAYGKVKLASNVNNGHNVAVKVIDRSKVVDRPQGTQQLAREINTMKILRHQNVVRLYEVIHTPAKIFMVMEYASGGDLLAYLNANGRLSEARAAELFGGMLEGLHFCHKLGVCHRDLKLENLLLVDESTVKIADFGMAALAPPASFCKTLCGSPDYAAPEILQEVAHYDGEVSDAWSSGVILYALLCRRLPFQAHQGDIQALFRSIKTGDFTIPPHVSELPADLIRHMLQTEPSRRWTVAQSRAHAWFKRGGSATGPKPIKSSVSMDVPRGQASLASAFATATIGTDEGMPEHWRAPRRGHNRSSSSSEDPRSSTSEEGHAGQKKPSSEQQPTHPPPSQPEPALKVVNSR